MCGSSRIGESPPGFGEPSIKDLAKAARIRRLAGTVAMQRQRDTRTTSALKKEEYRGAKFFLVSGPPGRNKMQAIALSPQARCFIHGAETRWPLHRDAIKPLYANKAGAPPKMCLKTCQNRVQQKFADIWFCHFVIALRKKSLASPAACRKHKNVGEVERTTILRNCDWQVALRRVHFRLYNSDYLQLCGASAPRAGGFRHVAKN